MPTTNQVEALLIEATLEYKKTGANREEVEYYAHLLLQVREDAKK